MHGFNSETSLSRFFLRGEWTKLLPHMQDNLDPEFSEADIANLDKNTKPLRALDGSTYLQGVF